MHTENELAAFIHRTTWADVSPDAQDVVLNMVSTVVGTTLAGAAEDGCVELRDLLRDRGGKPEATVFVHGGRLPAAAAAQLNGTMARALDYCDAMAPGLHLGSSLIPAALAAAELRGGVSGPELLTAVAVGAETGARLNLTERLYDGFDPTGVAGPMAATATVARVLELTVDQTMNALGLAFNRIGASFQSNVDGSLAVRLIQGWVAETGILCAQYAGAGLTGPTGFLGGVYGYAHLFGRGEIAPPDVVAGLGAEWCLEAMMFKKYPSCGLTQGATELALQAHAHGVLPDQVERIEVTLPPYGHRLVGSRFAPGDNPRVDAQFSAQYCVASALIRGSSTLDHFAPAAVLDAEVRQLADRVWVIADPALDARDHTAVDLDISLRDGRTLSYSLDVAPGFPGNALSPSEHEQRLHDCLAAAPHGIDSARRERLIHMLRSLDDVEDVRDLVSLLV